MEETKGTHLLALKGGWLLVGGRTAIPCAKVTAHRRGTAVDAVSETKPVRRLELALFMNAYLGQTEYSV